MCVGPHVHAGFCELCLAVPSPPPLCVLHRCSSARTTSQSCRFHLSNGLNGFQSYGMVTSQACNKHWTDFSEESPGEFAGAISHGINKLMHTLRRCQENQIRNAFKTWKSAKRSRSFAVSLQRPISCITID